MPQLHGAPSGLACMQCFKSKCKCVSRPNGDGCERCHRLKRQCHPSDSMRKSVNAQRRLHSAARIGHLEGKVDSLVKLLSLVAQSPGLSAALHSAVREDDTLAGYEQLLPQDDSDWTSSTVNTVIGGEDGDAAQSSRADSLPTDLSPPHISATSFDTLPSTHLAPDSSLMQDSETCLAIFRDKMLPSFSFTSILPTVTAQQLQRDRPFLLRAILAVASPSKEQKVARGRELKHVLAQLTLVQNFSSIDLLQGLLIFVAWSHEAYALSRLMLLAISLACDLRLDKPLPLDEHMMKPMIDDSNEEEDCLSKHGFVAEEQKAVLACYALSSMISIYYAQIDAMKWKPRLDEFLRAIEANKDCSSDVAFAFQVRLQLLAQKAVQIREQLEWDCARAGLNSGAALSTNCYIQTLQTQLHQLGDSLPAALQQRGTLIMHMHYIELCMNETTRTLYLNAVQGPISQPGGTSEGNDTNTSGGNTVDFNRFDSSWRSVGAIKAWMDMFFSLPPAECAGLSFIHMAQLARCLVVLYRLSTFAHPAWDCNLVRSTVDLLSVLDGVAEKLKLASNEAGERSPDDQFMRLSGMMHKFRTKAAANMGQKALAVEDTGWLNAVGDEGATIPNQTFLQQMNSGDEAFWEGVFRDLGDGWPV